LILGDPRSGRLGPAMKGQCTPESVGADFTTLSTHSAFNLFARPNSTAQTEAVVQRLETEVQRLRSTPVSAEELDYAKRRLLGGYLFDIETYAGQARMLGLNEMSSSYSAALSYFDNVKKLQPKDLQSFAQNFLTSAKQSVVILKPKAVQ